MTLRSRIIIALAVGSDTPTVTWQPSIVTSLNLALQASGLQSSKLDKLLLIGRYNLKPAVPQSPTFLSFRLDFGLLVSGRSFIRQVYARAGSSSGAVDNHSISGGIMVKGGMFVVALLRTSEFCLVLHLLQLPLVRFP
jgi:hypothetical protein